MTESQVDVEPQQVPSASRRGFLIRVGGGLIAAAAAPFVMALPAAAAGRCEYYTCEFVGFYISPSCVVYYWLECYDLDTGFHCKTVYIPV